ncbi:MAG: TetR/AcrR family transcriptional regulator [Campylobacterales bacterium]|nr:TetR/AcrR family transcriptional regulator [Campylobacterales bacterium]
MGSKKIEKDELVGIAGRLFRINGYANTSMQDIAEAAGLFKGSIYYYFANKELLLIAAIEKIHRHFDEHIFCLAYDDSKSQGTKMKAFVQATYEFFENRECGCLMGNVMLELPQEEGGVKSAIKNYFDDWAAAFVAILGGGRSDEVLAKEWVGNIQGALLIEKIYPKEKILKKTLDKIAAETIREAKNEK